MSLSHRIGRETETNRFKRNRKESLTAIPDKRAQLRHQGTSLNALAPLLRVVQGQQRWRRFLLHHILGCSILQGLLAAQVRGTHLSCALKLSSSTLAALETLLTH